MSFTAIAISSSPAPSLFSSFPAAAARSPHSSSSPLSAPSKRSLPPSSLPFSTPTPTPAILAQLKGSSATAPIPPSLPPSFASASAPATPSSLRFTPSASPMPIATRHPSPSPSSTSSSAPRFLCYACACSGVSKLFRLWFAADPTTDRPLRAADEVSVEWRRLRHHLHEFHHDDLQHFLSAAQRQPQLEHDYFPSHDSAASAASRFLEFSCCSPSASAFHSHLWCQCDAYLRPTEFLKPNQISAENLKDAPNENLSVVVAQQTAARMALKEHVKQCHANDFQDFFSKCDWFHTKTEKENNMKIETTSAPPSAAPSPLLSAVSPRSSAPASFHHPLSPRLSHLPPSSSSVFSSSSSASDVVEYDSAMLGLSEDEVRRLKRNEAEAKRRKGESDAMQLLAMLVEGSTAAHNRSDRLTIMRKSANAIKFLQNKVDQLHAAANGGHGENRKRKLEDESAHLPHDLDLALNDLKQTVLEAHVELNEQSVNISGALDTVRESARLIRTLMHRSRSAVNSPSHRFAPSTASSSSSSSALFHPIASTGSDSRTLSRASGAANSAPRFTPINFGSHSATPSKATPDSTPVPHTSAASTPAASLSALSRPGGEYVFSFTDTPLIIDALKNFSRANNSLIIFSRDSVRGEEQWTAVARELNGKIAAIREGQFALLQGRRVYNRLDALKRRHFQKASLDAIHAAHVALEGWLHKHSPRLLQFNAEHGTTLLTLPQLRQRLEQLIFLHQNGGVKSFAAGFGGADDVRDLFGARAHDVCDEVIQMFEAAIKNGLPIKDYDAFRWAADLYALSRIKLAGNGPGSFSVNGNGNGINSHHAAIQQLQERQKQLGHGSGSRSASASDDEGDDNDEDDGEDEFHEIAQMRSLQTSAIHANGNGHGHGHGAIAAHRASTVNAAHPGEDTESEDEDEDEDETDRAAKRVKKDRTAAENDDEHEDDDGAEEIIHLNRDGDDDDDDDNDDRLDQDVLPSDNNRQDAMHMDEERVAAQSIPEPSRDPAPTAAATS